MTCPDCEGKGEGWALVDCADRRQSGPRILSCSTCKGAGEITDDHARRIAEALAQFGAGSLFGSVEA